MKRIMILFAAVFSLIWGGCSDPFENQAFRETDKMPAASYMEANSSTYSVWVDLLNYTGLFNTVNLKMDYTCFVPDNDAMSAFLQKKGISSVQGLNKEEAANLVRYHTIASHQYTSSDFSDGMFPDSTASGDYLSLDMRDGGLEAMYINNEARIKRLNTMTTNAVIHTLESVLTPVTGMIVDNLGGEFSFMKNLLEVTGSKDMLSTLYVNDVKRRYTLFAVPNAVFTEAGIELNIASLAAYLGETDTNYDEEQNLVSRYVAYHIATTAYSYADLNADIDNNTSKNITMAASNSLMSCNLVNDAFYLNYDKGTQKGITVTEKNINCKNGVIHVVDGLLEEVVPKATTVKWDLTDYEELGAICEKFQLANLSATYLYNYLGFDYPSCYAYSSSNFDYYLANKNEVAYKCVNHDCLRFRFSKYGWIQMRTPMIIAGKYTVSLAHYNVAAKEKGGKWAVIIDGEYVGGQVTTTGESTSKSSYSTVKVGEVEFAESVTHIVRFLSGSTETSYLDCLIFEPVKE